MLYEIKEDYMGSMEKPGAKIAEGKTKIIWESGNANEVLIENKDDITTGDGTRRDTIGGKAALATQTTSNCFRLLTRAGIPNHFIGQETERMFRAQKVAMFPIELVARRVAFGSYLRRNPDAESGARFANVEFEMFSKDDPNHDPMLVFDFQNGTVSRYAASAPIEEATRLDTVPIVESKFGLTEEQMSLLTQLTTDTFEVLEAALADQQVTLVDLKMECGMTHEGEVVVADVIDNDSWRIWPGGDPDQMVDKQLYRDGWPLDYIADRYAWVAEATNRFSP
jgi:phosphoribosylaminoimidazole-succinocarboxamide synthase